MIPVFPFNVLHLQDVLSLLEFVVLVARLNVGPPDDGKLAKVVDLRQVVGATVAAQSAYLVVAAVHFLRQFVMLVDVDPVLIIFMLTVRSGGTRDPKTPRS